MLEVSRSVMKRPLRCCSTSAGSPSRSSSEYGAPLTWNSSVSAILPNAPMMPSLGLTTIDGSGSTGRRPGRSSRVKQSCRLLNSVFFASDRSRSENSRQQAIERSRTSGFSILLNQPMNRVMAARGMRLVSRKFRSSCWVQVDMRPLTVMNLSAGLISAVWHGFAHSDSLPFHRRDGCRRGLPETERAAGLVARQTPLADRTLEDVACHSAADPVLRVRYRRFLPFRRRAGGYRRPAPGRLLPALPSLRGALRQRPGDDVGSSIPDFRSAIHASLPGAVSVQPSGAGISRHRRLHGIVGW